MGVIFVLLDIYVFIQISILMKILQKELFIEISYSFVIQYDPTQLKKIREGKINLDVWITAILKN